MVYILCGTPKKQRAFLRRSLKPSKRKNGCQNQCHVRKTARLPPAVKKSWYCSHRRYIYLEPQTTIYKWMFGETTIFYIKIWNHPVETSIYKWLFGVPGTTTFTIKIYHSCNLNIPGNHGSYPVDGVPRNPVANSPLSDLRLAIHPIIYRCFSTSKRWLALGFLNHQQDSDSRISCDSMNSRILSRHFSRSWKSWFV